MSVVVFLVMLCLIGSSVVPTSLSNPLCKETVKLWDYLRNQTIGALPSTNCTKKRTNLFRRVIPLF